MNYYVFVVGAISVLWAACGLAQAGRASGRSETVGWLLLKTLFIAGEIAAVTALARGRDSLMGAIFTAVALIAGGLLVVVRSVAGDLAVLGGGRPLIRWLSGGMVVAISMLVLRWA